MPLFCMPAYLPVTAASVNYAPVVFVAFVGIASFWYFVWGRKNYAGPPKEEVADVEVAVRRQSEAHFQRRASEAANKHNMAEVQHEKAL